MHRHACAILSALLLTVGFAPSMRAADGPEGWAYAVADEIMSPFCPGRSLADCPSPQAENLRMWILVQEAGGRARAEVEAELLERYGDVILSAPRASGFGITAYAIPIGAFVLGGVIVAAFLRRQSRRAPEAPERAAESDPELERIVDEELTRT